MKKGITLLVLLLASVQFISAQMQNLRYVQKEEHKTQNITKPKRSFKGPLTTHNWTGTVSSDWNTPGNWDVGSVPTSTDNVTIPSGTPNSPVIGSGVSAYCAGLYLQSGASLTQNSGSYFFCYGTFDAGFGQFTMNGYSYLYFRGSTNSLWWDDNQDDTYAYVRVEKDLATASMTMQNLIHCNGTFEIREGVFKIRNISGNRLYINNTGSNALKIENGGMLELDGNDETIWDYGGVLFMDGSQLNMTNGAIVTEGNFKVENNTLYDIHFAGGLLQMSGSGTQYIQDLDGGNLQLNNLTIAKPSGTCYIADADLVLSGFIYITGDGGNFSCRASSGSSTVYDIYLSGGLWENAFGDAGFDQATGRVIFNGNYDQYCYTETFNELEINKSGGHFIVPDGSNVICAAYDWESGAVEVRNGGSFTANDLLDNAVQGGFILEDGGTINLTNSTPGTYVDLKGDLQISGGTMNVTGSISYWPFQEDASIEMSGGVLDFTSCGITIYDTPYSLTSNITGGIIRTAGGFSGQRADFTPTAGTFEFYGTYDVNLAQTNGCTLFNVNIDKSTKSQAQLKPGVISPDGRIDETIGDGKSNMAFLTSDFTVTDDFNISSGGFSMSSYNLDVAHAMDVYGSFHMNNVMNILTMGQNGTDRMSFYSGSIGDFTAGTVNMYGGIDTYAGCSFTATTDNTVLFKGTNAVGLKNNEPATVFGNMEVMKNPGNKMFISNVSLEPVIVNGNFIVHPNCGFETQVASIIIHGNFTDDPTSEIYAYETDAGSPGSIEIDTDFDLNGLLDVGPGDVLLHGNFNMAASSTLNITTGSFISDQGLLPSNMQVIPGTLNLTEGLFEITHNMIYLTSTTSTNISGGTIRSGLGFYIYPIAGIFEPTGGIVEVGTYIGSAIYSSNGNSFYNLKIKGNGTSSAIRTDIFITNDLIIDTDATLGCGWDDTDNFHFYIGHDWINNSGAGTFYPHLGTVTFFGSNPSDITTGETFYNLTIDKSYVNYNGVEINEGNTVNVLNDLEITDGTLEMNNNSTLDVDGNVHIAPDAGLNAYLDTGLNLFIGGNWTNDNTTFNSVAGYTPGTETITFDGTDDQIITTAAPEEKFGNLIIDKASGEFKPNDNIYVIQDFTLQNGDWADNVNGLSHSFEQDFTVNAGGYFSNAVNKNTVNFISDKDAEIHFASGGTSNGLFNAVVIDKAPVKAFVPGNGEPLSNGNTKPGKAPLTQNLTLTSNVFCGYNGGVTVQNGTLDLNGYIFTSTGNMAIGSGGTVNVSAGSKLKIDQNNILAVNSGGTLIISGTSGNPATVTHYNPGYYTFNVNNGGTLSAEYAVFEYINDFGVHLFAGSTLDPSHAFNHSTFQNIEPGLYASDITFSNDQILTCTDVNFPDNPGYNVWKANGAGEVTFVAATGDYAGPEYEYDPNDDVNWSDMDIELGLTVMLEGAYNGTDMNTSLNTLGLIPLSQPFGSIPDAMWYYTGTESVSSIPANVVDWVLVELRDAPDAASATESTVVDRQPGFLLNDGSVVALDGTSNISFTGIGYSDGLFAIAYHRNHLGVMSAVKIARSGGIYAYDFTAPGSAYSDTQPGEKDLGGGVYGMIGGDSNGSGLVALGDLANDWNPHAGETGYLPADYNLDGQLDNRDKNDIYVDNLWKMSQIPVTVGMLKSGKDSLNTNNEIK